MRAQASFRTRPRSLSSLMLLTVGLRETCPNNVPPNHIKRPKSCATFPTLEGFYFDPPYPIVSVTGLPRRTLRRLRYGLTLGAPLRQEARHGAEARRLGRLHGEDRRYGEDGPCDQYVQISKLVDRPQQASCLLRRLGRRRRS